MPEYLYHPAIADLNTSLTAKPVLSLIPATCILNPAYLLT
jgi:hypothetical protein